LKKILPVSDSSLKKKVQCWKWNSYPQFIQEWAGQEISHPNQETEQQSNKQPVREKTVRRNSFGSESCLWTLSRNAGFSVSFVKVCAGENYGEL
jgi:hypothetical protein